MYPQKKEPVATLLLVHGAGGSNRTWRNQHPLCDHFRLIALDLPGHGRSGGAGEATIGGYTNYVIDFIRSHRLRNLFIGGHSMGGAIALELALREPGLLDGMILVSTGAKLRVLPAIFAVIREDFELAVQGMAGFLFSSTAPAELVEEEKLQLRENSPDVLLKDFTACDSFDIMEKVDSIKLPALIVCGKEDRLTSPKYSDFLHSKLTGSELVFLDGCGHMPMLERSAEVNDRIRSFVERTRG